MAGERYPALARRVAPLALVLALVCCAADEPVTFRGQVAPLLEAECAGCHHAGGPAPFSLETYDDARSRVRQIAEATRDGLMPPWLPAPQPDAFVGERRLSEEQRETIERWAAAGAPEGEGEERPAPRRPESGWQLGEPDLELAMDGPWLLAAEGADEYRNFVVPVMVDGTRYVRAVELRPDDPRGLHHARLLLDRTPLSRYRDAETAEAGFAGMDGGSASSPEGHLLGWTPGKLPSPGRDDLAFRLEPGDDLLLQLHMVPTGKPESIRVRIGLHFAERTPVRHAFALVLGSRDIDIPPGSHDFRVAESYTLPVDVEVLAIYPHAHYTARTIDVHAVEPDGTRRSLIHIPAWDFDWQDEYRYASPVRLPAGTTLRMEYAYDNSAENSQNPSDPPRRVRYGPASTDEMAEVAVQLLPEDDSSLALLHRDFERYRIERAIDYRTRMLAREPGEPAHHAALGSIYLHVGQPALALSHLERALELAPGDATLEQNLAYVLRALDRREEALEHYRRALELDPRSAASAYDLGQTLVELGRGAEALPSFRRAIELRPEAPEPYAAAARVLVEHHADRPAAVREAVRLAERAVALDRTANPRSLDALARAQAAAGNLEEAVSAAELAQRLAVRRGELELARELGQRLADYRALYERSL